jgi:hypothetical protein
MNEEQKKIFLKAWNGEPLTETEYEKVKQFFPSIPVLVKREIRKLRRCSLLGAGLKRGDR